MAVSLKHFEKESTGLELLLDSCSLFAEVLRGFQECHSVCVHSKLFTKETILSVDGCAIEFRQLSMGTVTIARRVSDQWLDVAIDFFEHFNDVTINDARDLMKLLGEQARDLASCFKLIAAWGRNLSGRFHTVKDGTTRETEVFMRTFNESVDLAEITKSQATDIFEDANRIRKSAQNTATLCSLAKVLLKYISLPLDFTQTGVEICQKWMEETCEIERQAAMDLQKSITDLQSKRNDAEKAKHVAMKAGNLLKVLENLARVCEGIATFWLMEADKFDAQGGKMGTNQVVMMKSKSLRGRVCDSNIATWKQTRQDLESYISAMTVINSRFNFETTADPSYLKGVVFNKLGLTLGIPDCIKVESIIKKDKMKNVTIKHDKPTVTHCDTEQDYKAPLKRAIRRKYIRQISLKIFFLLFGVVMAIVLGAAYTNAYA